MISTCRYYSTWLPGTSAGTLNYLVDQVPVPGYHTSTRYPKIVYPYLMPSKPVVDYLVPVPGTKVCTQVDYLVPVVKGDFDDNVFRIKLQNIVILFLAAS